MTGIVAAYMNLAYDLYASIMSVRLTATVHFRQVRLFEPLKVFPQV